MPDKRSAFESCSSLILIARTFAVVSFIYAAQATSTLEEGDVRLVNDNDSTNMTGRLEVYHNGQWGTVCDEFFDSNVAMVVCRQLGFNPVGAMAVFRATYGRGTGPVLVADARCTGSEENITSCSLSFTSSNFCYHYDGAGVICPSNTTQPPIEVRLINGDDEHEGTVEILYAGLWGTICRNSGFDLANANVICRQLGYPGALQVTSYSQGIGQVWLKKLDCIGNESSLEQCSHSGFGTRSCFFRDVGVECIETIPPAQFSVRLIGGATEYEGRVEFYYNDQWGTVCDDSWDINDAQVVCRQLHFTGANEALGLAPFGAGSGPVWLSNVLCTGNEQELSECPHNTNNSFGSHNCNHSHDAGVRCTAPKDFDVRLRNGSTHSEGRVDVHYEGEWGAICDNAWDINDAMVICRQLGYTSALRPTIDSTYPVSNENSRLWLDYVACRGNESSIEFCAHSGWGETYCNINSEAGVVCTNETFEQTQMVQVRLINNGVVSSSTGIGRVEVLHDGLWGTVCSNNWDFLDAFVVCQQLGFNIAANITLYSGDVFGSGNTSDPIWLDNIHCTGHETNLGLCPHFGFGIEDCTHYYDSGVYCSNDTVNTNISIRLVGGNKNNEGRVEVFFNGEWGTVCDDSWGLTDANVVCTQLGFSHALEAPQSAHFGEGTGRIWMDEVLCLGFENKLWDCSFDGWGQHDCDHYEDSSVICEEFNSLPSTPLAIRIVGGAREYEGRVEIYNENYNGWGTICSQNWDRNDADVACRQLGYDGALYIQSYGPGSGPVYLTNFQCTGNEPMLFDCLNDGWNRVAGSCLDHSLDAGVVCNSSSVTCNNGDIRLVDGTSKYNGRLEVCYLDQWGTVCNDLFGDLDAQVACRQLGLNTDQASAQYYSFDSGTGFIWLDNIQCRGVENRLVDCIHNGFGEHDCYHYEDAGIICPPKNASVPVTLSVRVQEGDQPYNGRIEVMYNGEWGTICNMGWDLNDARVFCRQLGYVDVVATGLVSDYNYTAGSGRIWQTNVHCTGNEIRFGECIFSETWGDTGSCNHSMDVAVQCSSMRRELFPIELVNGDVPSEGRLLVLINGTFGAVCDDFFGLLEAQVACRQLNYTYAVTVVSSGEFGIGDDYEPIYFDNVICTGNESYLYECSYSTGHNCDHSEDVGIVCTSVAPSCDDGALRLVNGGEAEGRIEICFNNTWGTICDDDWDIYDARVACRQLGFLDAVRTAGFGAGFGPIYLDDVTCMGNETRLEDCSHNGVGIHDCSHTYDAGVVCSNNIVGPFPVRLVDGTDETEGRVEIFYNGEWGTVCDDTWELVSADVVCREIGCPNGATAALDEATFGPGTGTIWLDNIHCTGNELYLSECVHDGWAVHDCDHFEDAAVQCNKTGCDIRGRNKTNIEIRLAASSQSGSGRVEILFNDQWGTICDVFWGLADAEVACRDLGYSGALQATGGGYFGEGTGPIHRTQVNCQGFEPNLFTCPTQLNTSSCDHSMDAGVICITTPTCEEGAVRLRNGSQIAVLAGRIEICINNQWSAICSQGWSDLDAIVACRQLGQLTTTSRQIYQTADLFGQADVPILISNVSCSSQEEAVTNCSYDFLHNCLPNQIAGVQCKTLPLLPTRLAGGTVDGEGRVEVYYNNQWGTVCDDEWDLLDATVVCSQLGFVGAVGATKNSFFERAEENVPIQFDEVQCTGAEWNLGECKFATDHNCDNSDHSEDVGVICIVTGVPGVRIIGESPGAGRVEVSINGSWSTVCDDGWSLTEADVVCKQLGFTGAADFTNGSTTVDMFGVPDIKQSIISGNVRCTGHETTLVDCPGFDPSASTQCSIDHTQDVGVICFSTHPVRLSNGSKISGRVELFLNGRWGTVCGNNFNKLSGQVVCNQLNLGSISRIANPGEFPVGKSDQPIWLDEVHCTGNEEWLSACSHSGYGSNDCKHNEDVAIVCTGIIQELRLAGGDNARSGRVEIKIKDTWAQICGDLWNFNDSLVVCHYLGFNTSERVPMSSEFGISNSGYWVTEMQCSGKENDLNQCQYALYDSDGPSPTCTASYPANVVCLGLEQKEIIQELRLVGGDNARSGRVEIKIEGTWAQVCGDLWNFNNSLVVCRFLGFNASEQVPMSSEFGISNSGYWVTEMQCTGKENDLNQCQYTLYDNDGPSPTCAAGYPANVVCLGLEQKEIIQELRLVGGDNTRSGRVEIKIKDTWAQICGDLWNFNDSLVVCHYLGFNTSEQVPLGTKFGMSNSGYWVTEMQCSGKENDLNQCQYSLYDNDGPSPTCAAGYPANVVCSDAVTGNAGTSGGGDDDDNDGAMLAGILVPVLLVVLVIAVVLIITIVYMIKRSRDHKADDKVLYMLSDDEITLVTKDMTGGSNPLTDEE